MGNPVGFKPCGVCQAYVTPRSLDTAKLAARLSEQLPVHMMPSLITALEEMPLLFIGESVDRGALPLPDWAAADAVYVAPVNGLEAQLQAVWQEVLDRDRISTQSDFFAIGGNDTKVAPHTFLCKCCFVSAIPACSYRYCSDMAAA